MGQRPPAISLDRRQVIAHRLAAQQLDRSGDDPAALAVLYLGPQDTGRVGSARRRGTHPG